MTHIYVGELTIIVSDNGLSPGRRQAIIWTIAGILLIGPYGTNFIEILIEIRTFSFQMSLKVSSAKWRPFCLGLNVLTAEHFHVHRINTKDRQYLKTQLFWLSTQRIIATYSSTLVPEHKGCPPPNQHRYGNTDVNNRQTPWQLSSAPLIITILVTHSQNIPRIHYILLLSTRTGIQYDGILPV